MSELDRPRISQTALTKAGALGLQFVLTDGETLSGRLKYMVDHSGIASGRRRDRIRPTTAKRRRYGDFILVLKDGTLVDILTTNAGWCLTCLGVKELYDGSSSRRCPDCK